MDGQKREIACPFFPSEQGEKEKSRNMPAIYRVRLHKDEPLAAIYFNPLDANLPAAFFNPFFDKGELVTSFYWGSHWPLARGKTTGYAIDERVSLTPCHNSIISWAKNRPTPVRTARFDTVDTLGRSKPMQVQTWVWLIGMSDAGDARLLEWAHSFSTPPSVELKGAHGLPRIVRARAACDPNGRGRQERDDPIETRQGVRQSGVRTFESAEDALASGVGLARSVRRIMLGTARRSGSTRPWLTIHNCGSYLATDPRSEEANAC